MGVPVFPGGQRRRFWGNFLCFGSQRLPGSAGCGEGIWTGEGRNGDVAERPRQLQREGLFPRGHLDSLSG